MRSAVSVPSSYVVDVASVMSLQLVPPFVLICHWYDNVPSPDAAPVCVKAATLSPLQIV
jgi:hypothetical protein